MFRSPSARLAQQREPLVGGEIANHHHQLHHQQQLRSGSDGSTGLVGSSLAGSNATVAAANEVHHYLFKPSQQIVSTFVLI